MLNKIKRKDSENTSSKNMNIRKKISFAYKTYINGLKKIRYYELLFGILMVITLWSYDFLNYFSIMQLCLIFLFFYLIHPLFTIIKFYSKKFYWIIYFILVLLLLYYFINKYLFFQIPYLSSYFIFGDFTAIVILYILIERTFFLIKKKLISFNNETKIKRYLYQKHLQLKEKLDLFSVSNKKLFILNIIILIILSYLNYIGYFSFSPSSYNTLLQTNATIFALVLTISLSIVTTNEYSKITGYYQEALFIGWNLIFFLSYLIIISLNIFFKSSFLFILSFFMMFNTLIFIINLTFNIKSENILMILCERIKRQINEGNYKLGTTTIKSNFSWDIVKGNKSDVKVIDKFKELEENFNLLERVAHYSYSINDKDTFKYTIRTYFSIARHLIGHINYDFSFLKSYLYPIWSIYDEIGNEMFRNIIIMEVLLDFKNYDIFTVTDIQLWNLERFKLMVAISNSTTSDDKEYTIAILIEMLSLLDENYKEVYNNKSIYPYSNILKTKEFTEFKKEINFSEIDTNKLDKEINRFHFYYDKEKEKFENIYEKILEHIKKN